MSTSDVCSQLSHGARRLLEQCPTFSLSALNKKKCALSDMVEKDLFLTALCIIQIFCET